MRVALLKNPFGILGVGPDVSREATERRAKEIGTAEALEARRTLIAPRLRLEAEVAFLPGASTKGAARVLNDLRAGRTPSPWDLSLPARANLFADRAASGTEDAEYLREFAQLHARVRPADLAEIIAEDRAKAELPKPTAEMLERPFEKLKDAHAEALAEGLARLGDGPGAALFDELIRANSASEGPQGALLRRAVSAWGRKTASRVAQAEEAAARAEKALEAAADRQHAQALAQAIKTWAGLTAPPRAIDAIAGLPHRPSVQIAWRWHRLAVAIVNDRNAPRAALPILEALATCFADLPEFGLAVGRDLEACRRLVKDAEILGRPEVQRLTKAMESAKRSADATALALRDVNAADPTAPQAVAELAAAFRDAARAKAGDAPWILLRDFALWAGNEKKLTVLALSLTELMLSCAKAEEAQGKVDAALLARMEDDLRVFRRELLTKRHEAEIREKRYRDAVRTIDELAGIVPDAQEKDRLAALRANVETRAALTDRLDAQIQARNYRSAVRTINELIGVVPDAQERYRLAALRANIRTQEALADQLAAEIQARNYRSAVRTINELIGVVPDAQERDRLYALRANTETRAALTERLDAEIRTKRYRDAVRTIDELVALAAEPQEKDRLQALRANTETRAILTERLVSAIREKRHRDAVRTIDEVLQVVPDAKERDWLAALRASIGREAKQRARRQLLGAAAVVGLVGLATLVKYGGSDHRSQPPPVPFPPQLRVEDPPPDPEPPQPPRREVLTPPPQPKPAPRPADLNDPEFARVLQERLKALNFFDGPVDGSFGPRSRAALRALKRSRGLADNDAIDEPTLRALSLRIAPRID